MLWNTDPSSKRNRPFGWKKHDTTKQGFTVLVHIDNLTPRRSGRKVFTQDGLALNHHHDNEYTAPASSTFQGRWQTGDPSLKDAWSGEERQTLDENQKSSSYLTSFGESTPRRRNFSMRDESVYGDSPKTFTSDDDPNLRTNTNENVPNLYELKGEYDADNDEAAPGFEVYQQTRMQISERNGIITFYYDNQGGESSSKSEQKDQSRRDRHSEENESFTDVNMSPLTSTNQNAHNLDYTPDRTGSNPAFELIPTKNQTHKDHKQRELSKTKKACLEVAADAYKNLGIEIPDMILAQINDHLNHLKVKIDSDTDGIVPENESSLRDSREPNSLALPRDSMTRSRSSTLETSSSAKKIHLHTSDEIHVAPCQCALRLLGIKERKVPFDSMSFKNRNIHLKADKSMTVGTKSTDRRGKASIGVIEQSKNNVIRKNVRSGEARMVKTASAFASQHNHKTKVWDGEKKSSFLARNNETQEENVAKSHAKKGFHDRSESSFFTGLGYHEITLIRNENKKSIAKSEEICAEWDAVTIRCSDHDELDLLIKLLRDSSRAKVVPFSSNPKEKLRRKRKSQRRIGRQVDTFLLGKAPQPEQIRSLPSHDSYSEEKYTVGQAETNSSHMNIHPNFCMPTRPDKEDTAVKSPHLKSPENNNQTIQKQKRIPWDLNFNKKEYCELCDLTFTLLTRRHHCRRCERSCCGHCSNLLIVKGCEEKRYCNRCSIDILSKQAEALRGRTRQQQYETSLPGKVHGMCRQLGVGVVGKLPHWKTYLRLAPEMRPAVGRLTVEVIEAIALPSVDLVNGKVDPYVRATITGYDRDMRWSLRQWLSSKRYSLCSRFCTATLSPVWRGAGRKGGELLTLPVISTAGAVLRLEVLHYNVLTNSRGKDTVLGYVEIPLSDLPNANLREPGGIAVETSDGKRTTLMFDGYVDRWYRLVPSEKLSDNAIMLSRPISSPCIKHANEGGRSRKVGIESLEEVGRRFQALCIAPVEWFAQAIKLDLPARRPEAICKDHRSRSMIHIRIKLNASLFGDVLSHAFFPPVRPRPLPPPYDPEILWTRILKVGKELGPYRRIQQYIERVIKWKHEPNVCVRAYFIFAFHVAIFPHLLKVFHVYLFIFLGVRLSDMKARENDVEEIHLKCSESFDDKSKNVDDVVAQKHDHLDSGLEFHDSPSLTELVHQQKQTSVTMKQESVTRISTNFVSTGKSNAQDQEEETAKLNIAISWVARRLGDNKGLEVLQFKLMFLAQDLQNINSVWNGTNPLLTRLVMLYLVISFVLHFIIEQRLLWGMGTFIWYFGQSPFCIRMVRFFFGFWRGIAKVTRRQHLLDAEVLRSLQ